MEPPLFWERTDFFRVRTAVYILFPEFCPAIFVKACGPHRSQFSWRQVSENLWNQLRAEKAWEEEFQRYNFLQRLAFTLAVIFLLSPLVIVSGLAMSPAVVSVYPLLVKVFGGHQSARTIHFLVTCLLVLFLIVHVVMVSFARIRPQDALAMITGRTAA